MLLDAISLEQLDRRSGLNFLEAISKVPVVDLDFVAWVPQKD